jgi:hypothetical protein
MKIEQALRKNGDGNNTAKQNEPHQRPPLLHVVDHSRLIDELSPACKDEGRGALERGASDGGHGGKEEDTEDGEGKA